MPDSAGVSSFLLPPPPPLADAAAGAVISPLHSLQRPQHLPLPSPLLPLPSSPHLQGVQQLQQLALDRGAGLRPGFQVYEDQQRAAAAREGVGICKGRGARGG